MLRTILVLIVTTLFHIGYADDETMIVCNATSKNAVAGTRYAYQIKGFAAKNTDGLRGTRFAGNPSIDIFSISPLNAIRSVATLETASLVNQQEECTQSSCKLIQNLKFPQASYGLTFQTHENLNTNGSDIVFSGVHHLNENLPSALQGVCRTQPFVIFGRHHRNDTIVDFNGKYLITPDHMEPQVISDTAFFTKINPVNLGAAVNVQGGTIGATSFHYVNRKVAVAVAHTAASAVYVHDMETLSIQNIVYQRNGRAVPAGTTDALPSIQSVKFDETGALAVETTDDAGFRYEMNFSSELKYVSCRVLKNGQGAPVYCPL